MKNNIIKEKSFSFAVRITKLTRILRERKVETILINQLLRSGTSISANVEEAIASISRKEFSAKISISYKESRETLFWLKLLFETNVLTEEEYRSIFNDCDEINRILFSILKTTRIKQNEQ